MTVTRKTTISGAFLRFTSLLSALTILGLGGLWIADDIYRFEQDSRRLQEEFVNAHKNLVRQEVEAFLTKIGDKQASLEDSLRRNVQSRTEEAWALADSLFRRGDGRLDRQEIEATIREALRTIRYNNGRGYFFATRLDGVEQLFADRPQLEGRNVLDMKDSTGKPVIQDMIRIAREQGEGFYEYLWTKPGAEGDRHRKLAYVKYHKGLGWFIGTGEYLEDVEADFKDEVIRQLDSETFGDGGYLFATTMDGISLTRPAKGKNMLNVTDVNGLKIVQTLIATARSGGGFVEYVLPAFEGVTPHRKLSYVRLVKDWDWYIGAGLNMDSIDREMAGRRERLWQSTIRHSAVLLGVLFAILLGQYIIVGRVTARLRTGMAALLDFFKNPDQAHIQLTPEEQPYVELAEFTATANAITASRLSAEKALQGSEARYKRLVDNAMDAIFLATEDGRLIDTNNTASRQLGSTHSELTGMNVWDVDTQATADDYYRLRSVLGESGTAVIAGQHRRKDGSVFPVEIKVAAFREDGRTLVLGLARDITERVEAQEKLKQSESKFLHIFQSSPDAIFLVHLESEAVREVNDACTRLFDRTREELLGRTTRDSGLFANPEDRERILAELRSGGVISNMEVEMLRKDRKVLICLLSSQALSIEGEMFALTTCHDVTDQTRIREMMIQTEKMISVGGIAAGIAHEINNPLGIILQAAQNLGLRTQADFPRNQEAAREIGLDLELMARYIKIRKLDVFIEDIREAGVRAAYIVRNMLDFTRHGESKRALCNIRDIAEKSLNLARSDYDLKKGYDFKKVRVDIVEGDNVPPVLCSETEIEQVLINLFRNAAQAIGGAQQPVLDPRIEVRISSSKQGWARIEIEDNGPGMPAEVRRHIFEPFFTTKKPGEGTGLGLSVSYFIITRDHGGTIDVSTGAAGGALFTIDLPVTPRTPQDMEIQG